MELKLDRLPHTIEIMRGEAGPSVKYVDQRLLPAQLVVEETQDWRAVVDAIKTLAVRGAPAIGIAGAAALALWEAHGGERSERAAVVEEIANARPTAVNLRWAVERALAEVDGVPESLRAEAMADFVESLQAQDEQCNRAMGANGASLLPYGARVLTHCNAGSLATYFYGTALGVVYAAAAEGKIERVYADETRPVGQGARLTAWELAKAGVPVTLICDNMAASLMASGRIDAVVVGADRIARNGDTANKIGTYGVAVLAKEHGVPFYVAAPSSTVDGSIDDGSGIVIEQRASDEVMAEPIEGVDVWNPAFDVTPARYIAKIITEKGVFDPPNITETL